MIQQNKLVKKISKMIEQNRLIKKIRKIIKKQVYNGYLYNPITTISNSVLEFSFYDNRIKLQLNDERCIIKINEDRYRLEKQDGEQIKINDNMYKLKT